MSERRRTLSHRVLESGKDAEALYVCSRHLKGPLSQRGAPRRVGKIKTVNESERGRPSPLKDRVSAYEIRNPGSSRSIDRVGKVRKLALTSGSSGYRINSRANELAAKPHVIEFTRASS